MGLRWLQAALLCIALLCTLGASCDGGRQAVAAINAPFDEQRAWQDLVKQVDFGPRVPGTQAHAKAQQWLHDQLAALSPAVSLQPFTHKLGGKNVKMWNIIASFSGKGTEPRERVLLAAHWDSRPTADHDPDPDLRKKPIDGANDGASGVAILLEIARQLKENPIDRDVVIVLFDGEDYGPKIDNMLLGSKYYAAHLPAKKADWGILLDMVGDKDLSIPREPNSEEKAKAVNDRVFAAARALGYMKVGDLPGFVDAPYRFPITDDHIPINEAGIPMADLIDFDYPAWHTSKDTVDQCSKESLKVVGKTVLYAIQMP